MSASAISVGRLVEEPYASVICYPRASRPELRKRLKQLERLRVTSVEFTGAKKAFNLSVLGKGYVGVVTIAYRNGDRVAMKIRRTDADRAMMAHEAKMLKKANSVQVGPRLLDSSRDFLVMEFIDGVLLPQWLGGRRGTSQVKRFLRELFEECWLLDQIGLDHGELSHAPKHVIISSGHPCIVDFESASTSRRPSNVTSICQFVFIGGSIAGRVARLLGKKNRKTVIAMLRKYKESRSRENFEAVLKVCGLQTM